MSRSAGEILAGSKDNSRLTTYLDQQANGNADVCPCDVVQLAEPFRESSWSKSEGLTTIAPSMKFDETTLSSDISHESDVACLEDGNAAGEYD